MTARALPAPIAAVIRLRQRKDGSWRGTIYARDGIDPGRWEISAAHADPDALDRYLGSRFAELMTVTRPGRLIEITRERLPWPRISPETAGTAAPHMET